jgi:hypothetical protein
LYLNIIFLKKTIIQLESNKRQDKLRFLKFQT